MLNPFGLIHSLALSVCVVQFFQGNPQVVSPTGIQFRGNKVFSNDQLLNAMQLAFGLDMNGSTGLSVDRGALTKGADRARKFMADQGYLISEVGDPRFERSNKGLTLIIPITEGPLYRLGRVRFENSTLFSPEQLLDLFGMKEGDIAVSFSTRILDGIERLKRLYSNHGYLQWTIIPMTEMNDDEGFVHCTFRLEEGPVFSIRRLTFSGSTKTNEQALRTQFLIGEGQLFNWQLLDESLLRVHQLGLTEEIQPSDVRLKLDESTHQVDVTINLKGSPHFPNP